MNAKGPNDLPLDKWPVGWLKLEVASLTREPDYLIMSPHRKVTLNLPVTEEEMRLFVMERRKK